MIAFQKLTALPLFTDNSEIELCLQNCISQLMLHQIQRSESVLESACHEDFKTDPDLWFYAALTEIFKVEDKAQFPKSQ